MNDSSTSTAPPSRPGTEAVETPVYERRGVPFGLAVLLLTLALDGAGTPAFAETTARPGDQTQCQVSNLPTAGVFAGEYVNGAPIYRFATVVVTGSRKASTAARPRPGRQSIASGARSPA